MTSLLLLADAMAPKFTALWQLKKVSRPRAYNGRSELYVYAARGKVSAVAAVSAVCTGVKRNANFAKLQAGYLFPEVSVAQHFATVT